MKLGSARHLEKLSRHLQVWLLVRQYYQSTHLESLHLCKIDDHRPLSRLFTTLYALSRFCSGTLYSQPHLPAPIRSSHSLISLLGHLANNHLQIRYNLTHRSLATDEFPPQPSFPKSSAVKAILNLFFHTYHSAPWSRTPSSTTRSALRQMLRNRSSNRHIVKAL